MYRALPLLPLAKLMREQPELYEKVEAALDQSKHEPSATSKRKTSIAKRKKVDVEPYRRRVRGIMHSLDRMRASEAYWHVGGLTDELRGVEKTAIALERSALLGLLSKLWKDWREALVIVKPETVINWHRDGFRLYWRWKSKAPVGRPQIDQEIRDLIRRMSRENTLWGLARIQSELRLLGFDVHCAS